VKKMAKKLYKNPSKKKIAGVCQGVAEYFDIDPTIVRILWFVVSWFYGVGVGIYILMWIILPDKSEVADVLEEEDLNKSKVKDFYKDKNEDKEE
jgi:phage shock protein PspC (stress-responsive transcriptional regulator)